MALLLIPDLFSSSGTLAKFNPAYQIVWATYYGGETDEGFQDIAYSAYGNYVFGVGDTYSSNHQRHIRAASTTMGV
ncbi:MAG: hypothetical protein IPG92_04505 [Flavobacteriales bacterium]|nr:hypothetical protein [Flavobacteriales bacterium]